jgi:hypothetical protein
MAVTARIGGISGDRIWTIEYDDATRNVTCVATGGGFDFVTVQVTSTITRTVAIYPIGGGQSVRAPLAAEMATADFKVTADGVPVILASGISPAAVARITGKTGETIGGLPSEDEGRPT